jgi:starch synthase
MSNPTSNYSFKPRLAVPAFKLTPVAKSAPLVTPRVVIRPGGAMFKPSQFYAPVGTSQSYLYSTAPTPQPTNSPPAVFQRAPRPANPSALDVIGEKIQEIECFAKELVNRPDFKNQTCVGAFKQYVGEKAFNQICAELARLKTGTPDIKAGQDLLDKNIRNLLLIRDDSGKNPLEKVVDHLSDAHRAIKEINNLGATLISLEEATQKARAGLSSSSLCSDLKNKAESEFNALSLKAMGALCKRIWEIDGRPNSPDHGRATILADIKKLLQHRGNNLIKDSLAQIELEEIPPLKFSTVLTVPVEMQVSDTPITIKDVQSVWQLKELKLLLDDYSQGNELLVKKFNALHPDLQETLKKLIWIAHDKPDSPDFGGRLLAAKGMWTLLNVQNNKPEDIITQLISHHIGKVNTQRLQKDLEDFAKNPHQQSAPSLLTKFNALSLKAKEDLRDRVWRSHGGGNHNPDFGGWNYGGRTIDSNPHCLFGGSPSIVSNYLTDLKQKFEEVDKALFADLDSTKPKNFTSYDASIDRLSRLQELKLFLDDPLKDNELLVKKFNELQLDLQEMLKTLVWIAHGKPEALGFADHLLAKDMRTLLKIQNNNGKDIVTQLISHHIGKVKAQEFQKELEYFAENFNQSPSSLLDKFNALSLKTKEDLREKVWHTHGGDSNPDFGGLNYGENTINSNPHCLFAGSRPIVLLCLTDLKQKLEEADKALFAGLDSTKPKKFTFSDMPIPVSSKTLEEEQDLIKNVPKDLRVAFITAELSGVASIGGLASAVDGMVQSFGAEDARVIMPLYANGPIKSELRAAMKETDHEITIEGEKVKILKTKVKDVRCYFIDFPKFFWIDQKSNGASGNIYESLRDRPGSHDHVQCRWAAFQKAAADLSYAFSKKKDHPVQLIHLHDAQTGLVPKFLRHNHPQEWERGETPATVFTFHNNREPNTYQSQGSMAYLEYLGLPIHPDGPIHPNGANSLIAALEDSDMVTTVSETFAKEAQMRNRDFGNGMEENVQRAALQGKLVGIINGNSNGYDPTLDETLKNWISCLPENKGKAMKVDLSFGPDLPPEELAGKLKAIQKEICACLKDLPLDDPAHADLDPEKPIVMYLGRYDMLQKGINKLPLIMEETLAKGGQFICVGVEPDSDAQSILNQMKKDAYHKHSKKGILILEDKKVDGKLTYQQTRGYGSLLRAACSVPIFPSRYEPCGLVQGEFNRFGKKVVATHTGGFVDTLKTTGPDANGYLFKRESDWESSKQNEEIKKTLGVALGEAMQAQRAIHYRDNADGMRSVEHMKTVMSNALASTWETTTDGSSSSARKIELVYAKALQKVKARRKGFASVNLKIFKL